jgi:hypothetical protein
VKGEKMFKAFGKWLWRRRKFWFNVTLFLSVVIVSIIETGFPPIIVVTFLSFVGDLLYTGTIFLNGKPPKKAGDPPQLMWPGRMALLWNTLNILGNNATSIILYKAYRLPLKAWLTLVAAIGCAIASFALFNHFESFIVPPE